MASVLAEPTRALLRRLSDPEQSVEARAELDAMSVRDLLLIVVATARAYPSIAAEQRTALGWQADVEATCAATATPAADPDPDERGDYWTPIDRIPSVLAALETAGYAPDESWLREQAARRGWIEPDGQAGQAVMSGLVPEPDRTLYEADLAWLRTSTPLTEKPTADMTPRHAAIAERMRLRWLDRVHLVHTRPDGTVLLYVEREDDRQAFHIIARSDSPNDVCQAVDAELQQRIEAERARVERLRVAARRAEDNLDRHRRRDDALDRLGAYDRHLATAAKRWHRADAELFKEATA